MRPRLLWCLLLVFLLEWIPQSALAGPPPARDFKLEKLGEGVYAVIRTYPPGLMCDGNSPFIIDADGVVVVDAPEASREMLAALRTLTKKPVKYVINTHGHDDHITGNQIYKEAFPGVEFIGHERMRDYLSTSGETNRKQMIEGAPKFVEYIRGEMEKGKSIDLGAFKQRFAGDSKLYRFLFDMYVTGPAVTSAFNGAKGAASPGVNP